MYKASILKKYINDGMFIEDLVRWCRWRQALHYKTAILCSYDDSCLILYIIGCKDQRENVQIIDNLWLITVLAIWVTRRVSLIVQELPTFSKHLGSHPVFGGIRVTRSYFSV